MLEDELDRIEMDEALKRYKSTRRHNSSQNGSHDGDGEYRRPKNLELGERPSSAKKNKIDALDFEVESPQKA